MPVIAELSLISNNPTKHLCILARAPLWHLIFTIFLQGAGNAVSWCYLGQICIISGANLASKFKHINSILLQLYTLLRLYSHRY